MSEVGDIKPAGPVWPQPAVEKVRKKQDAKERQPSQREPPPHAEGDDEAGGSIDEYA